MKSELTKAQLQELEQQLSCPSGEAGLSVGENMHRTNISMTRNSIDFLKIKEGNRVLELGHGNAGHLSGLLSQANGVKYVGLEISQTMHEAAKAQKSQDAEFKLYDGANIPYPDAHFDRVFSVNSIYFWEQPLKLLNEIARTLKVDGICVLTYAEKEFMQKLPFVKDRFKLFNRDAMEELVRPSNLNILGFESKTEEVQSKSGEFVTRNYTMVRLSNK